jgi:5'-3' exonuclease
MNNLLLVDTNGFNHFIVEKILNGQLAVYDLEKLMRINLVYMLTGTMTRGLDDKTPLQVVFLTDSKPYWRESLLKTLDINYKGKRQNKHQMAKVSLLNMVTETLEKTLFDLCKCCTFNLYSVHSHNYETVGYEADDLAAGVILNVKNNFKQIFVLTDDTDWLPFTFIENVTWLGIADRNPRVRTKDVVLEWVKKSNTFTMTKERKAFSINCPRDIWAFKSYFGDTSDNLRGDKKDKTEEKYSKYIDLFNPHHPFECWNEPDFLLNFYGCLTPPKTPKTLNDITSKAGSIPLVICPYSIEDKEFSAFKWSK